MQASTAVLLINTLQSRAEVTDSAEMKRDPGKHSWPFGHGLCTLTLLM